MIGLAIKQFVGGNVLWLGLGAAFVTLVIGWDSSRKAAWVNKGAETVRVEIRKTNDAAVKIGTSAARKSLSPGVQAVRQRDPSTRDD